MLHPAILRRRRQGDPLAAYKVNGLTPSIIGDFVNDVYRSPLVDGEAVIGDVVVESGYTKTANGLEAAHPDIPALRNGALAGLDLSNGLSIAIEGSVSYADNNGPEIHMLSAVYAHILQLTLDTTSTHVGRAQVTQTDSTGTHYAKSGNAIAPGLRVPVRIAARITATEIQSAINGAVSTVTAVSEVGNFLHPSNNIPFAWPTNVGNSMVVDTVRVWAGDIGAAGLVQVSAAPGYDVILLAGQSNMVGNDTYDSLGVHDASTFQWKQDDTVAAASPPLDHIGAPAGSMGLDITFSTDYRAAHPHRRLLLVPVAEGSTGFADNRWNPGDDLYQNAVARANAALAGLPDARMTGILWLQGEQDAFASMSGAAYASALDAMIAGMRSDITGAANVPFVAGEFLDIANATFPTETEIRAAILDTPNRVAMTAAAPGSDLTHLGDGLHFDAPSLRTMGSRMYTALATLL